MIFVCFFFKFSEPSKPQKLCFYIGFRRFFDKSACRYEHRFLITCWCQFSSILTPKIDQNPIKKRSRKQPDFLLFFESSFQRFWLHFRSHVGAMLATFSAPKGGACEVLPSSLLSSVHFSIFLDSGSIFDPILLRFGSDLPSIFEVSGNIFHTVLNPFCYYCCCYVEALGAKKCYTTRFAYPAQPSQLRQPSQPNQPSQLTGAQPAQPVKPAHLVQSIQSAQPAQPD